MKATHIIPMVGLLGGLLTTPMLAQSQDQYQTAMSTLVTQIDTTKGAVENIKLANTFNRIAEVEKTRWLPYYYAGYYTILESLQQTDMTKVDAFCDQAERYLDQAAGLSPKNSEIACLRAMINLSKIRVNQMARGMAGMMQAQQNLEEAHAYDEQNPRVYFMLGQQAFYTPDAFGGSKEKALRYFEKALTLMEAQKDRERTIDVHWGRSTATKMAAACRQQLALASKADK